MALEKVGMIDSLYILLERTALAVVVTLEILQ